MRLGEWSRAEVPGDFAGTWARRVIAKQVAELRGTDDAVAFATFDQPSKQNGRETLIVIAYVVLPDGLGRFVAERDTAEAGNGTGTLAWTLRPWREVGSGILLEQSATEPEGYRPVKLRIGGEELQGSRNDRADLIELYAECARRSA